MSLFSLSQIRVIAFLATAVLARAEPVRAGSLSCANVFSYDGAGSINDAASWDLPSVARVRFESVVQHQNQIRLATGAPLLHLPQTNISSLRSKGSASVVIPMNGWADEAAGNFSIKGQDLIRDGYNDIFDLNFVYRFDGAKLIEAVPYAIWKLNQMNGPEVVLYRAMNDQELNLWKERKFSSLGRVWGHRTSRSQEEPIIHFSTDSELTSAGKAAVRVRIPKKALLSWLKKTGRLWSGRISRDDDSMDVSEFVLPTELVVQLVQNNQFKIDFIR